MKPLSSLYLFPVYQTRDEYRLKTGREAPPFNPARPVKSWEHPAAVNNVSRKVVYPWVIALDDHGRPLTDERGRPFFEPMMLDREDAATVNIPAKDFSGRLPEVATVGIEVPVPCRGLAEEEELTLFGPGGLVMVSLPEDRLTPVSFTIEDRNLLRAIAKALGV